MKITATVKAQWTDDNCSFESADLLFFLLLFLPMLLLAVESIEEKIGLLIHLLRRRREGEEERVGSEMDFMVAVSGTSGGFSLDNDGEGDVERGRAVADERQHCVNGERSHVKLEVVRGEVSALRERVTLLGSREAELLVES
ncbi:hypothetical protein ACLOJK_040865 [Asimina triloba]